MMNKADYILTQTTTVDKVLLQKCISLDQELKDALFDDGSVEEGMNFMNFIQMYYSNDEIIRIWESIGTLEPDFIQSGMRFFRNTNCKILFDNFKKVDTDFIDLFTEFVRLRSIEIDWLRRNFAICYPHCPVNNIDYVHP